MKKFINIISTAVPLPLEEVDTDQIIPARYLKAIDREGFGDHLFHDWRFDKKGEEVQDFVLNDEIYKGQILVTGRNFGCGSSREHAAWALYDYGFRIVISSYFADIFYGNALNNGLLPIVVSEEVLKELFVQLEVNPALELKVSLTDQLLEIGENREEVSFSINSYKKECLINGYDDIDYLISIRDEIEGFEKKHNIPAVF